MSTAAAQLTDTINTILPPGAPFTLHVDVTAGHIAGGCCGVPTACPIAWAIRHALERAGRRRNHDQAVVVLGDCVHVDLIGNRAFMAELPGQARAWIEQYDDTDTPATAPFSFDLTFNPAVFGA